MDLMMRLIHSAEERLISIAFASFEFVCVSLTSLFLLCCCIPILHQRIRLILRPWAIFHVENGLYWVAFAQGFKSSLLTFLFEQSSHSVSVLFYGSVIPAIIWLGFPELGWQLVILMTVSLYVGNAMKDLVCAPRPLGLKFGRIKVSCLCSSEVETGKNAFEFGLPSSHTMNSICFNFYICHYFHRKGLFSDDMALGFYLLVTLWVSWIAISRIYLGLHTPIDILAGAVAGLTVLTAFLSLRDILGHFVFQPFSGLATLLISAILLRLHPKPIHHTPSFEFSTSFVGVSFGVVSALSIGTPLFETATSLREHDYALIYVARRLLVGYLVVLVSKSISKAFFSFLLPFLYVAFPMPVRKLWQPPVHDQFSAARTVSIMPRIPDGSPADVDATARFLSYAGLGFGTCYIAPVVFQYCNW